MLSGNISEQLTENNGNEWQLKHFTDKSESLVSTRVMRKFVNSAIYIEKPLSNTISSENFSVCGNISSESLQENKTKRCTCSVDYRTCPCHLNNCISLSPKDEKMVVTPTKVIKKKTKISPNLKPATQVVQGNNQLKKCVTKKEEIQKKENETKNILEAKIKEKESLLEKERENFKKWLLNKKKKELEDKRKKEKELEEQQLKELEKEKRQLENQLNFQLWLKKKEEELLEKKIKKQIDLISELERKEKQLQENERAFNEWLKEAKNRQKPLPLNRGLESLRSSTSVTYVNPNPWNSIS